MNTSGITFGSAKPKAFETGKAAMITPTIGKTSESHRMTVLSFTEETIEEFLHGKKPIDLYDDMTVSGYNVIRNGTNGVVLKGMITRDMRHYCHDGEKWVNRINCKDTI
tara:strand:+ start:1071 stop:1397 length:327 start_codon:yes stop_codon:yes gene_type:complete